MSTSRDGSLESQLDVVLQKMDRIKSLIFHSLFKTAIFIEWHQDYASIEDKVMMRYVSDELAKCIFPDGLPDASDPEDVRARAKQLYEDLLRLRAEFYALLTASEISGNPRLAILLVLNRQYTDRLLAKREHNLGDNAALQKIDARILGGVEGLFTNVARLSDVSPALILSLREKIVAIKRVLDDLSLQDSNLSKHMRMDSWRDAVRDLYAQKDPTRILAIMANDRSLLCCLDNLADKLVPLQAAFFQFKNSRELDHKQISTVLDDWAAWNERKRLDKERYQQKIQNENASKRMTLFHEQQLQEQKCTEALALYQAHDYVGALKLFLDGVKHQYTRSALMAGKMILRGEGCQRDAGLALDIFRAALLSA